MHRKRWRKWRAPTSIPIATGERLRHQVDFGRLLRARRGCHPANESRPVGGILEAKKIAGMAEVDHAQIRAAPVLRLRS